jgi:hypothetical protein
VHGWIKKRLENIAKDFSSEGMKVKIHVLAGSPSQKVCSGKFCSEVRRET